MGLHHMPTDPTDEVEDMNRARESALAHAREMHYNADVHSNQELMWYWESEIDRLTCL